MRLALAHKDNLADLGSIKDALEIRQGRSVGAVWLVYQVARRLGVEKALGTEQAGKLAMFQVLSRVIDQGSRLSAVRLASRHAGCDILGITEGFNEDTLYQNLAWLTKQQKRIEKRLFNIRCKGIKPELFLYDVTSSYLEGLHNELADWGYNRDKKSGKKQVVVGLLCDEEGVPVSVEVFAGNTNDPATVGSQIKKLAKEFGAERVTLVGDRGMIKSGQINQLQAEEFHYITAITKPQIESLLKTGVFQMELFADDICEIEQDDLRYILRRNPLRAKEMADTRKQKKEAVEELCRERNAYLSQHPKAKLETALALISGKIERLKISGWLKAEADNRRIYLVEDESALTAEAKLDGCYVIKSDLPQPLDKQIIHDRYRDLALVEQAFRTSKTAMLEMRPWYVQTEASTRGHALVVMLAYMIVRHLQQAWANLDLTVEEGLDELSNLCSQEIVVKNGGSYQQIPTPNQTSAELFNAANVALPKLLPHLNTIVVSRKKLPESRRNLCPL
jgi:transposase